MRRWTSVYRFSWKPIITFSSRRQRLLEWVERNLEPSRFLDNPNGDHLGLALSDPSVRMSISQSSLLLEDLHASPEGVASLSPVLDGIFEVLEPKFTVLHSASVAWSLDLPGLEYNEARGRLAALISGLDSNESMINAIDTSMLVDLRTEGFKGQVEWGIVEPRELQARVEQPQMGRLSGLRTHANLGAEVIHALPPASVFLDSNLEQTESGSVDSREGIELAVDGVTALSEYVCERIGRSVLARLGDKL